MIIIKDYTGGVETVHGPYKEVRFRCLNQSFPAITEPTVTFTVRTADDDFQSVTVSLVHEIEPAQKHE